MNLKRVTPSRNSFAITPSAGITDPATWKNWSEIGSGWPKNSKRTRPDGTVLEVRGRPTDAGGFVTTYTDITARKQAEQIIRASEQQLSAILEASPIGVSIHSFDGECLFANQAFADMLGCTLTEAMTFNAAEIYSDRNMRSRVLDAMKRGERLDGVESEQQRRDGSTARVLLHFQPLDYGGQTALIAWHYDLTERLEDEQEIRESEQRLRTLLDTSPIGVSIIDDSTNQRVWANSRLAEMHDTTVEDLMGTVTAEVFADPTAWSRMLEQARRDGGVRDLELLVQRADGSQYWALISIEPIQFEGRKGRIAWAYDITERKQAEQAVVEQSEILEEVMESVDQGISMVDKNLNGLALNSRFFELLEFPTEIFSVDDPFDKFIRYNAERGDYGPGDVEEQVRTRVVLASKFEPHQFERHRPDGTVMEIRGRPTKSGGFVTTYTDITTRKLAEQALRESEERLSTILEASPVGVSIIDGNGVRVWANSRLAEMYGQSVESLIGQDTAEVFMDPAARARVRDEFDRSGLVRDMETMMRRADGTEFWALISMEPTEFGGENARIAWVYDIEERRQAEQAQHVLLESSPVGVSIVLGERHHRIRKFPTGGDDRTVQGAALTYWRPRPLRKSGRS